jgi:hypothetical protein
VPEGEGVKGVDRQSLRAVQAQLADDAVLHLDRRLPGEGHGQDPARIDALPNQMHKAAKVVVLPAPGPAKVS